MKSAMDELKDHRMEQSVFIDIENDPNETGLVGGPYSLITTDEGDLDAKLTTLDPNFAAVIIDLMYQLDLKKNDTVAVLVAIKQRKCTVAVAVQNRFGNSRNRCYSRAGCPAHYMRSASFVLPGKIPHRRHAFKGISCF